MIYQTSYGLTSKGAGCRSVPASRFRQEALSADGGPVMTIHESSEDYLKQILIILLTVLVEDNEPYVLFMDEPEVSLHMEWQKRLIDLCLELNPNVQIILTTHSPAVVMNGWVDSVTEVSDITV
jgi:predicted ATPase